MNRYALKSFRPIHLFSFIFSALIFLNSSSFASATPPSDDLSGVYCYNNDIITTTPILPDGSCYGDSIKDDQANICKSVQYFNDQLMVRPKPDKSLDFVVSSWQSGEHNCAIAGNAVPHPQGGWIYTTIYSSDGQGEERCALHFKVTDDKRIKFTAAVNAQCRFACGSKASFDNISIPLSTKTNIAVQDEFLKSVSRIMIQPSLCPTESQDKRDQRQQ